MTPVSTNPADSTNGTNGTNGSNGTDPSSGTGTGDSSLNGLTNESTFLQLLVSQIKNQDPLNPTDSIQFVSQLVSFSQLEQLLNINQNIQVLDNDAAAPPSTSSSTTQSSSTQPSAELSNALPLSTHPLSPSSPEIKASYL